jgi:hypothetical protein
MTRPVQEPEVRMETGPHAGEISSHPAFGQISASRVSGSQNLYGSDFSHNHYVSIRINASEMKRDLAHDWYFARKEYIEVFLSEAQWATFVSSMNHGSGPCCTISHLNGESLPELPAPKSRTEQLSSEVGERLNKVLASIQAAMDRVDSFNLSKVKTKELKEDLVRAVQDLKSNLPYVAKSFDEHAEKTVEKAKAEVHGYMVGTLMRAGIQAIQDGQLPLAIELQKPPADQ